MTALWIIGGVIYFLLACFWIGFFWKIWNVNWRQLDDSPFPLGVVICGLLWGAFVPAFLAYKLGQRAVNCVNRKTR